jgi:hypothetical protein
MRRLAGARSTTCHRGAERAVAVRACVLARGGVVCCGLPRGVRRGWWRAIRGRRRGEAAGLVGGGARRREGPAGAGAGARARGGSCGRRMEALRERSRRATGAAGGDHAVAYRVARRERRARPRSGTCPARRAVRRVRRPRCLDAGSLRHRHARAALAGVRAHGDRRVAGGASRHVPDSEAARGAVPPAAQAGHHHAAMPRLGAGLAAGMSTDGVPALPRHCVDRC